MRHRWLAAPITLALAAAAVTAQPGAANAVPVNCSVVQYNCGTPADAPQGAVTDTASQDLLKQCLSTGCPSEVRLEEDSVIVVGGDVNEKRQPLEQARFVGRVYGCLEAGTTRTLGRGTIPGEGWHFDSLGALPVIELSHILRRFVVGVLPIVVATPPRPTANVIISGVDVTAHWGHVVDVTIDPLYWHIRADHVYGKISQYNEPDRWVDIPAVDLWVAAVKNLEGEPVVEFNVHTQDGVMTLQEGREQCGW